MNLEIATSQNFMKEYFFFKSSEIVTLGNKRWFVEEGEDKFSELFTKLSN